MTAANDTKREKMCQKTQRALHKRSEESAGLIGEALLALMEEKPYAEVTVSEICRRATTSRNTFYRLFRTREDVLEYVMTSRVKRMLREHGEKARYDPIRPARADIEEEYRRFYRFWEKEKKVLRLFVQAGRMDIFRRDFDQLVRHTLTQDVVRYYEREEEFAEYYYTWLIYALSGLLEKWAQRGFTETPGEMTALTIRLFQTPNYRFAVDPKRKG